MPTRPDTQECWGVIPARGGSKGIPRKNLQDLAGRSLLAWTTSAALASGLDRVLLSTDDEEIAEEGWRLGVEVPFLRPPELATDTSSSISVVQHLLHQLGDPPETIMLLQPTSPFRTGGDINTALSMMASDPEADSVISVCEAGGFHPARCRLIDRGLLVDPPFVDTAEGQPRQSLEPVFLLNGAIYLTRLATVLGGSFRGHRSLPLIMAPERSVNIDQELDLFLARALAAEATDCSGGF